MFKTCNGPFGGLRCIHLFSAVTTALWARDIPVLSAHHPIYSPLCYCMISSNLCIQKRQVPARRQLPVQKEKTVQKKRGRCQAAQQAFLPWLSSGMEPEMPTSPHQTIWHWGVVLSRDFGQWELCGSVLRGLGGTFLLSWWKRQMWISPHIPSFFCLVWRLKTWDCGSHFVTTRIIDKKPSISELLHWCRYHLPPARYMWKNKAIRDWACNSHW